jgi:hypothetical protein
VSKSSKNRERRAKVEQMRAEAKAAERRRSLIVIAVCSVLAIAIIGFAGVHWYNQKQETDKLNAADLDQIGVSASAAGCEPVSEMDATGEQQHVDTPVIYKVSPPSFGPHNPVPADAGIHIYTADDRPEVEVLVHNEEHGWTILWYDSTVGDDADQMAELQATAKKFDAHGSDPRYNLIIAPWLKSDGQGDPIPDGKHIAFTHWSIHQPTYDPKNFQGYSSTDNPIPSWGVSQYCSSFSGAALADFMAKYPYDDAPEGFLWHQ